MDEHDFKIIAIKPLAGCKKEYVKVLEEDHVYFLYNNYSISSKDEVTYTEQVPNDFFSSALPHINISAIVGKNGTGKSTLIELLFMVINNLAFKENNINENLKWIRGVKVHIYFKTDNFYKIEADLSSVSVLKLNRKSSNRTFPNSSTSKFKLKDFFYTVAINYSHYAYNGFDYPQNEQWLDGLFHKNDGYQIPIVINPMRTGGNIDINTENHLVKARLIANLIRPVKDESYNFRKVTNNLEAISLALKLNESKTLSVLYEIKNKKGKITKKVKLTDLQSNKENILRTLNSIYNFGYTKFDHEEYRIATDYIIYKLVSITLKYDEYKIFFLPDGIKFDEILLKDFLNLIINDSSHITFKLKQVLNFLKFRHIKLTTQKIDLDDFSKIVNNIINKNKNKIHDLIELIPPPIFTTDIFLKSSNFSSEIQFKLLSSGEKQMIYSVSSLLYHLYNLDSVPTRGKRTSYKFVNLVLEEIELYFHPEMQRKYIQYILKSISNIQLKNIVGINICFVTHSPFILSDIPENNILFLYEKENPVEHETHKTFGGNIHELLAKSFFLENALIGEFARNKIDTIIEQLQPENEYKIADPEKEKIMQAINLIGESFIRQKLTQMFYNKFYRERRIAELQAELDRLKND